MIGIPLAVLLGSAMLTGGSMYSSGQGSKAAREGVKEERKRTKEEEMTESLRNLMLMWGLSAAQGAAMQGDLSRAGSLSSANNTTPFVPSLGSAFM